MDRSHHKGAPATKMMTHNEDFCLYRKETVFFENGRSSKSLLVVGEGYWVILDCRNQDGDSFLSFSEKRFFIAMRRSGLEAAGILQSMIFK